MKLTKTVNKIERSAFLSDRIYALTLSSNYARRKNAYKAYKYVIKQLPTGTFKYVHEKSENGKYHVHGIMDFKYSFNYKNLQESLVTSDGRSFDIHIQYQKIGSYIDLIDWHNYSSKHQPIWKEYSSDPEQCGSQKIPISCIPEIQKTTYTKSVYIPGL